MISEQEIEKWVDGRKIPSDSEVEEAGQRLDRRLRHMRFRRRMVRGIASGAAVLMLGMGVGLWMLERQPAPSEEVLVQAQPAVHEEPPRVPTLILADGSGVKLHEQTGGETFGDSLSVRMDGQRVVYDTAVHTWEVMYNELVNPAGYISELTLADGTQVVMNAGSRLKYPVEFSGDARRVELSGEAYFHVTKGAKPFEVYIAGSMVRVYGTRFNVRTTCHHTVEAVLVEGKIGFTPGEGRQEVAVSPGQQATYDSAAGTVELNRVDPRHATAWMEKVFRYRDTRLDFILEDIAAWYGVDFKSETDLSGLEITMNLSKQIPIEKVLSFLELMTGCKFKEERGRYVVSR